MPLTIADDNGADDDTPALMPTPAPSPPLLSTQLPWPRQTPTSYPPNPPSPPHPLTAPPNDDTPPPLSMSSSTADTTVLPPTAPQPAPVQPVRPSPDRPPNPPSFNPSSLVPQTPPTSTAIVAAGTSLSTTSTANRPSATASPTFVDLSTPSPLSLVLSQSSDVAAPPPSPSPSISPLLATTAPPATTVYSYYDVYDSPFARFDPNRRISIRQDSVLTAFIVLCTVGLAGVVVHRLLSVRGAKKKASRQSPPSNPTQSQDDDTHNISHTQSATSGDPPQHINWRNLADLQLEISAIELVTPLAAGSYGVVWRAKLRSNEVVAVKTCSRTSLDDVQNFVDELALLSTLHSPYLVSLLGVTWTHACDLKAVLEYMDSGDLRQLLDNAPPPSPQLVANSPSFSWRQKLECALSVGHALVYLKQQHVIHRDLKSRNVLLDSKCGTKLADFGIAKHLHDDTTHASMTTGVGTYRWMAPEVLTFRRYSVAVDVYSFGVLLTELDTHRVPFTDVQNDHGRSVADAAVVCMVLYEHLRPSFSNKCPLWFVELGRRCMQADARDRPTPEDVVDILTCQLGMLANVMEDVVDER